MELFALLGINPASWVTSFVTTMFKDLLGSIGTAAAHVLGALVGFMNATTEPVFSGGWWTGTGENVFVRVLAVAGSLMFVGFAMSVVSSVLSRDQTIMARAALHLPLAVIEMAMLVTVTAALVSASDEIAAYIAGGGSKGLTAFVTVTLGLAVTSGGLVGILIAAFIILAGLMVWAVLIVRTALVYVAVMAGPLIFASTIHPATRHVHKRYIEGALAIIGSKIVMAIAFATGSAMLGGLSGSMTFAEAIGALMQALAILLIAAFSPFIFIKLLIGAEALAIAEGIERRPARAGMSATTGIYHGAGLKSALGQMSGSAGNPGGSADGGGGDQPGGSGGGGGSGAPGGGPAGSDTGAGVAQAVARSRRFAEGTRTSGARTAGPPAEPARIDAPTPAPARSPTRHSGPRRSPGATVSERASNASAPSAAELDPGALGSVPELPRHLGPSTPAATSPLGPTRRDGGALGRRTPRGSTPSLSADGPRESPNDEARTDGSSATPHHARRLPAPIPQGEEGEPR